MHSTLSTFFFLFMHNTLVSCTMHCLHSSCTIHCLQFICCSTCELCWMYISATFGTMIFLCSFFPYFYVVTPDTSAFHKTLSCLCLPICFGLGVTQFANFEKSAIGNLITVDLFVGTFLSHHRAVVVWCEAAQAKCVLLVGVVRWSGWCGTAEYGVRWCGVVCDVGVWCRWYERRVYAHVVGGSDGVVGWRSNDGWCDDGVAE